MVLDRSGWSSVNLAWLSGLIEGEGSVFVMTPPYRYHTLRINMTDLDVLEKVQQITGGSITGPHKQPKAHHRDQYRWYLTSERDAAELIPMLEPWLGQRRRRMFAGIVDLHSRRPGSGRVPRGAGSKIPLVRLVDPVGPTPMPASPENSPEMWAWIAGLIEGEGSIDSWTTAGKYSRWRVAVAMTDADVLYRAQASTGLGLVHGPYLPSPDKSHHKPVWRWQVQRMEEVQTLLTTILPSLGERRSSRARAVLAHMQSVALSKTCRNGLHSRVGASGKCEACEAARRKRANDAARARRHAAKQISPVDAF